MTLAHATISIDHLMAHGFTQRHANAQLVSIEKAYSYISAFIQIPFEQLSCYWVPGVLNVAGKHTDYAGGSSLNAPIDLGINFLSAPREDHFVQLFTSSDDTVIININEPLNTETADWSDYCRKVMKRIQDDFQVTLKGVNISFDSQIPSGAGMAASSSLICGFFKILVEVNQLETHPIYQKYLNTPEAIATYLGCIEYDHSFIGRSDHLGAEIFGGCEQYAAMVCAGGNGFLESQFRPLVLGNHILMPKGYSLVIGTTGVTTKVKHGAVSHLKNTVKIASMIAEIWRQETGKSHKHLGEILDNDLESETFLRDVFIETDDAVYTRDELSKRFEHFVSEHTQIVPAVISGLMRSCFNEVGLQLDRSHKLANLLLSNHVPQTNCLYETAKDHGALVVNTTGSGFGSSVWAIIESNNASLFLEQWQLGYETNFPDQKELALFLETAIAPSFLRLQ